MSYQQTSDTSHPEVKRPSLFFGLTEGLRAMLELGCYLPYRVLDGNQGTGDGHPVLILPGFMATDLSTMPLRSYIHKIGYKVYGWGEGRNYAQVEYIDLMQRRLELIYQRHGEPVSVIGWSLGGIYARELAKRDPEMVRQVIVMGTPLRGITEANNAQWLYELLKKGKYTEVADQAILEDIPTPAEVPTTSIYSKEDGVVPWQLCLEDESDIHQNVQVRGSHLGLGVNPLVLQIIKDRLSYAKANWVRFRTGNMLEDLLVNP